MDQLNLLRVNRRLAARASGARDANMAEAKPVRSAVFSEIKTVVVSGQPLRIGIRRGRKSSPPLVLFNGIGASLELLEPFVKALKGVEVVAFDIPGIGGSPAPAVPYRYSQLVHLTDGLLATLGYDGQVDVLGLSWGGMLAQQYAYANPQRCRRLILAATSTGWIMVPGRLSAIIRLTNPRRYAYPPRSKRFALGIGSLRRRLKLVGRDPRTVQPPRGLGYLYQLTALWGWTSVLWLHRLRQPTLVMAGTEDKVIPLANAEMLARLIPHARLFTIDDGHLFLITRADEVAHVVRRFLAERVTRRGRRIGARLRGLRRRLRRMRAPIRSSSLGRGAGVHVA
jgi:poly(3-hydroxyalkanoate) depolymerase